MKNLSGIIGVVIISIFLHGCSSGGSGDKKKGDTKTVSDSLTTEKKKGSKDQDVNKEVKKMYVLPSTLQIASTFNKAGLSFKKGIVNDPSKAGDYISITRKKLNFGVYSADLAYASINNREQESLELMKAVMEMAEQLGLTSIFDTGDLSERFEKNLGKKDSMITILSSIQEKFDSYIERNGESSLRLIAYTGGWVESMYIGSRVKDPDKKVLQRVKSQMRLLEKLLEGIDTHVRRKDETLKKVTSDLSELHKEYGGKDLTQKDLDKIGKKIAEVRSYITSTGQ